MPQDMLHLEAEIICSVFSALSSNKIIIGLFKYNIHSPIHKTSMLNMKNIIPSGKLNLLHKKVFNIQMHKSATNKTFRLLLLVHAKTVVSINHLKIYG